MRFTTLAMLMTFAATPLAAQEAQMTYPTITVNGEGEVSARPDMATVTLGVETLGDSANAALAENTAATAKMLETLKAAGIAAKDMQTSDLTLGPRWEQPQQGQPKVVGFVAANNVTVTVRDLNKLGSVLDTVVRNGANTFQGLRFGLSDPKPNADAARKAAVADAIARAHLYAEAAGVALGPVQSLTESFTGQQPRPMMRMSADSGAGVPLAEGEVSVNANVTMVFRLGQ